LHTLQVLVAIGGATYSGWDKINQTAANIASFVREFGLDGVDIDYEEATSCTKDSTGGLGSLRSWPCTQSSRPYKV
jgi:chitinase